MSHFGFRISAFGFRAILCILAMTGVVQDCSSAEIVLQETRMDVIARAVIDREKVGLSGELVTLVLTVEGPGRVEVAPPRPLLSKSSALSWNVHETGLPTVEILDNGRQRWQQEFQLSPYDVGPKVRIELAPLRVKAGNHAEMPISWSKRAEIEVEITIGPDRTLAPITGIEKLPPAPPLFTPRPKPWMLVGLVISIVFIVGAFVLILVLRNKPDAIPLTGAARALRDLTNLQSSALDRAADFNRIADIIRLYLDERFHVPAKHRTTAELLVVLQKDQPLFGPFLAQLKDLLEICDLAKFAGVISTSDYTDSINRAATIVERTAKIGSDSNVANPK